jgi:hypothetical protein
MRAAAQLRPADSIRPLMYSTLFGLLAVTGMRISEVLALRVVDVAADGLIVQRTKFQKSRLIPVHGTTRCALDDYLVVRARLGTLDDGLFVADTGKAPAYSTVVGPSYDSPDRSGCGAVLADDVDCLAVVVGGTAVIAAGLADHAEAIIAIVHIGEARQEIVGGVLGGVELAGMDEVDDGVGCRGQLVGDLGFGSGKLARRGGGVACGDLVCLARQQRLYLLPLPQGQGSFRPVLTISATSTRRTASRVPSASGGYQIP